MKFRQLLGCFLVCISVHSLQAQAQQGGDQLFSRYGIYGNVGLISHSADFRAFPGVPNCCPKFQSGTGVPMALQWYGQQLQDSQAALVVAPETAIPLLPQQLIPGYLEGIQHGIPMPFVAITLTHDFLAGIAYECAPLEQKHIHHVVP